MMNLIRTLLPKARALRLLAPLIVLCPQLALAAGSFTTPPTIDSTAPVMMEAPSVVSLTDTTAIIRWVTDEIADSQVQYGSGVLTELAIVSLRRQEHIVTLTGLTAQTAYTYRVVSTDPSGNTMTGSTLAFSTLATPDTTAPGFASGPTVGQISAYAATVSWTTSEPATWVLRYGTGGSLTEQVTGEEMAIARDVLLTNLVPGRVYSVQVSAWDVAGNLGTGTPPNFITLPATPVGVSATTSAGAFSLSWSNAQGATTYNVYRARQAGVTRQNYASLPGGQKHAGVSSPFGLNANAGETWYFVVTASNPASESPESAEASVTIAATIDTQAPTVPAALTANAVGSTQINLAWSASTDNVGVTSYKVYRGGTLIATLGNVTSYSDSGLTASTAYSYTVQACDAAGNCSAQSAAAAATTLGAGTSFTPSIEPSWNLLGNALNITLDVATIFGTPSAQVASVTPNIVSIWKWVAASSAWAYYSPQLTAAQISAFAASKGYFVLSSIGPGEGYWVNAAAAFTMPAQSGTAFSYASGNYALLPSSWNLIATAQNVYPTAFANTVSALGAPASGANTEDTFVSLWAWDAAQAAWYYYSPVLENITGAQGGLTAVKNFAGSKGYLHFQDYAKKLDVGTGFWVNRP